MKLNQLQPSASFIVPCFNQGIYLGECLTSVQRQSRKDWECVVVDDGSTDDTAEIAAEFVKSDPRFTYYRQTNRGLSGARNTGMGLATGTYLNFLDADDSCESDMLERFLAVFDAQPELDLVFSGWKSTRVSLNAEYSQTTPRFDPQSSALFEELCKGNLFPVHAALVRRQLTLNTGNFDETLRSCEDWDFWLRIARCTNRTLALPWPLVRYRLRLGSMTRNVDTFFSSGITVLARTAASDDRVQDPLPVYRSGFLKNFSSARREWFKRNMGLYLAARNLEKATQLFSTLKSYGEFLHPDDFVNIWRYLLIGAISPMKKRQQAWNEFGPIYMDFLNYCADVDCDQTLVHRARTKIKYFNATRITRFVLRTLARTPT